MNRNKYEFIYFKKENFLDANGETISQYQYEINVDLQNQKFKVTKKTSTKPFSLSRNLFSQKNYNSKVTDLEQKTEKVLAKFTKIIFNMTQLEDIFSIETPAFMLVHKKSNISSFPFDMEIENNSFKLPKFSNLTNSNNQTNQTKQIILKV